MNTQYFSSIIDQVNACTTCAQLAQVSSQASTQIGQLQADITAQLALLGPLIIAPTDLPSVLTWINSMINTYLGPQATLIAQQGILATQLSNILAAVSAKSSELECV